MEKGSWSEIRAYIRIERDRRFWVKADDVETTHPRSSHYRHPLAQPSAAGCDKATSWPCERRTRCVKQVWIKACEQASANADDGAAYKILSTLPVPAGVMPGHTCPNPRAHYSRIKSNQNGAIQPLHAMTKARISAGTGATGFCDFSWFLRRHVSERSNLHWGYAETTRLSKGTQVAGLIHWDCYSGPIDGS